MNHSRLPRFVPPLIVLALCLTAIPACDGQTGTISDANESRPANQSASDTAGDAAVRPAVPPTVGNFNWPRLLGETFDGVGNCDGVTFDWSRRPVVAWQLEVGEGYGLGSVVDGRYFHFDATSGEQGAVERLRAIDMADGSQVWSHERPLAYRDMYGYESGPRGTPTASGDRIITLGVGGDLCCRNRNDGKLIWSVDTNRTYGVVQNFFGVGSSPLIHEGLVIVAVGGSPPEDQRIAPGRLDRVISNGSALVAFDLASGQERWRCGDDLASYSSPRTMTVGDEEIVLYFARDHLLAVDPTQGEVLWKRAHRAEILESVNGILPVVDGDRIFISECYQIGSVLLQADKTGAKVIWQDDVNNRRKQVMRSHWSTPILIDGHLYGCSGRNNPDSDLRCIEFATGKLRWADKRRIRSSVAVAGEHLIVWEEQGLMEIVRPSPEKLDVIAQYDFGDLIADPCWAAPIVVGNRILIRGDSRVLCLAVPPKSAD